jgi:hypothetical protein
MAEAISASFCGVLNTHERFASTGVTIAALAAMLIIGVDSSDATSTIASEFGVIDEPTITSTMSSLISLRVFLTAVVTSDASSRTMYSTLLPPMDLGNSATEFFCGMPSDAAGPVADSEMPTLICASALPDATNASAAHARSATVRPRWMK